MAQFARPDGSISDGGWTATPLFSKINVAIPDDGENVRSVNDPSNDIFEVSLNDDITDPVTDLGHIVRIRMEKATSGGGQQRDLNIIVGLYETTTLRATATFSDISTGLVTFTFTLTGGEADSIGNYDNLRVRVDADVVGGSRTSWCEVTGIEFEVPDVGAKEGTASGTGSGTGAATGVEPTSHFRTGAGTGSGTGAATGQRLASRTASGTGSGTGAATGNKVVAGPGQNHFRLRPDDEAGLNGNAAPDWEAAEDVSATMAVGDREFRLRFSVSVAGAVTDGFQLRAQKNGAGGYSVIGDESVNPWDTINNKFQVSAAPSISYTDLDATTELLTASAGSFVAGDGNYDPTQAPITFAAADDYTELEWTIVIRKTARNWADSANVHNADGDFYDFRVYFDDGTVLDNYNVTPRVTLGNVPGHIGGTSPETSQRIFITDDDGNMYYVGEYADTPGTAATALMLKSTDGGDSWEIMDEGGQPSSFNDIESIDMHYIAADDTIYIGSQQNNDARFYSFRVAGHASPDTWDIDQLVDDGVSPDDQNAALHWRDDNTAVLFYNDTVGIIQITRYKIRSSGGTWGSQLTLDTEGGTTNVQGVRTVMDDADDLIHIFYHTWDDGVSGEIWHRTLNSSDTLSGRLQVDDGATIDIGGGGGANSIAGCVLWDDDGTQRVGVVYLDDSTDDMIWNESVTSSIDFLGNSTEVIALVDVDKAVLGGSMPSADVQVDPVDNVIWVFGTDLSTTTAHLKYNRRQDGVWNDTAGIELNTNVTKMPRISVFTHSAGNGGKRVVGYIYTDRLNRPYTSGGATGMLRYDEFVLGSPTPDDFVAAEHVDSATSDSTLTINKPTGVVEDDVMVAFLSHESGADPTWTGPSGWTKLGTTRTQGESNHNSTTWWKAAGGSEPSSYDWLVTTANQWSGCILAYRNRNTSAPIDDDTEIADANVVDPTLSVTTTEIDTILVNFWTYEPAAQETYFLDAMRKVKTGRDNALMLGAWDEDAAAIATYNRTVDFTGITDDHSGHLIALAPSSGAETGTASGTGSGTGAATGNPTHKGNATGTGSGTGAATGVRTASRTASGTGSGAGAATGQRIASRTASGTGSGTGSATGVRRPTRTASGTGSGTGAATGLPTHKATAAGTSDDRSGGLTSAQARVQVQRQAPRLAQPRVPGQEPALPLVVRPVRRLPLAQGLVLVLPPVSRLVAPTSERPVVLALVLVPQQVYGQPRGQALAQVQEQALPLGCRPIRVRPQAPGLVLVRLQASRQAMLLARALVQEQPQAYGRP